MSQLGRIVRKGWAPREAGGRRAATARTLTAAGVALLLLPTGAFGQRLEEFDYENLSLRSVGVEGAYIFPSRVEVSRAYGVRMDLGYLGPGLRIAPRLTYWDSPLKRSEVDRLENRLERLIEWELPEGTPVPSVSLGEIAWRDIALSLDGHFVWSVPFGLLGYSGVGIAVHLLNGRGEAIDDTFVEDLLDSWQAGFNLHAGLEYPAHRNLRLHAEGRYEVLGDLQYLAVTLGVHIFFGSPVSGEGSNR